MSVEHAQTRQRRPVPHLDGVVPQPASNDQFEFRRLFRCEGGIQGAKQHSPRDDLGVVVLEAVDALRVLRAAVDALQVVLATPPIVFYSVYVPETTREANV